MAASFKGYHGKPTDAEALGRPPMELTSTMIQYDDPIAFPLTPVASKEDGEDVMTLTHVDVTGSVKEVQRRVKVASLPTDAESLRCKI